MSCLFLFVGSLLKLHSTQRLSNWFLFIQFRSFRDFGFNVFGIICINPPPFVLLPSFLSNLNFLERSLFNSQSFWSLDSFNQVSDNPSTVLSPRPFKMICICSFFCTILWQLAWKNLVFFGAFRNSCESFLKFTVGPGFPTFRYLPNQISVWLWLSKDQSLSRASWTNVFSQ